MRNSIIKGLLLSGIVVAMTGCDENAWNDKLDGFDGNQPITDIKTIEYTLTAADYSAISTNSANVALAGDNAAALKAIGTQQYFTDAMPASKYLPAFFASTSFKYFTLSDGSAVKVTYNVAEALPAEIDALASAKEYVVSDDDYIYAWDSDDNYVPAYTPQVSPSKNIPALLKANYPDAAAGDYVIVNYNYSTQEPVFGTVGGDDPTPGFVPSSVLGSVSVGETVDVNAVITAMSTVGFIATDASGSILVYWGKTFDKSLYKIGDQIVMNATISAYGTGLQIAGDNDAITVVGNQAVTYPTPTVMSGADFDQAVTRSGNYAPIYAQFTGEVVISGNYINFNVEGATSSQGSAYNATDEIKAKLVNGSTATIYGYFIAISSKKYCNFVITDVQTTAKAPAAPVTSVNTNAVYTYNGSKWSEVKDVAILQPSDYTEMGQSYGNLSNNLPAELLPIYLAKKYPYAQADDSKYVLYKYYNGSATSYRCDQYLYNGTEWTINKGVITETAQFVRNGGV